MDEDFDVERFKELKSWLVFWRAEGLYKWTSNPNEIDHEPIYLDFIRSQSKRRFVVI